MYRKTVIKPRRNSEIFAPRHRGAGIQPNKDLIPNDAMRPILTLLMMAIMTFLLFMALHSSLQLAEIK
jgi:hypothetical protein